MSGSAKFNEIFKEVTETAKSYLTKRALEDTTVLTRTDPQEVGKVPTVDSDIDNKKKDDAENIVNTPRALPIHTNPGSKQNDPAVKAVNEPANPAKAEKIANAKSLLAKVRALKASKNAKSAGANDIEAFLNDFINEDDNSQEKTAEEELAELGGENTAKLINMIKQAGNIESFILKQAEEEKARQKQDYAIAYEIGATMKKMEKEAADLKAENEDLKKKLSGDITKTAGKTLDKDAAEAAQVRYDEVIAEKVLCKKANIDWKMANTQLNLEKLKGEGTTGNFPQG